MLRTGSDGQLATLLEATRATIADAPEARAFAHALASLEAPASLPRRPPANLAVLRWWTACLTQPGPPAVRAIADALAALRPALAFTQNPNYVAAPPSASFLARYGYSVLAGPAGGPPAPIEHPGLAFGVLLLGPRTTYPAHVHPATELYLPLGRARWSAGSGPLVERPSGAPIVHRSCEPHETRTADFPLAALYVWLGELGTAARLVEPGVTRP